MDYEKKYNDALERAKKLMVGFEGYDANVEIIKNIFPELRESEDEMHREWILEYLYDGLRKADEQFKDHFKSAIDWLEKQKPEEWSEEDERIRNLAIEWAETMSGQCSFVDMDPTDFRKIAIWLKSLRPQPKQDCQGKR